MQFKEAFTGFTLKSAFPLLVVVAGMIVVGRPVLHFLSQVCELAANALPSVVK